MFCVRRCAVQIISQCGRSETLTLKFGEMCLNKASRITSYRGLPARGTKPLKQFLWDERHLEKLTNGKYTHRPLRVNRLGGRHPDTGRKINQHIGGGVKFDYFCAFLFLLFLCIFLYLYF